MSLLRMPTRVRRRKVLACEGFGTPSLEVSAVGCQCILKTKC